MVAVSLNIKDSLINTHAQLAHLREHNAALVLGVVARHGPITQRETSKICGLSFTSVVSIITHLEKNGIVKKSKVVSSLAGRPAAMYQFDPSYRYIVGCEMQHDKVRFILADLNGQITTQRIFPFDKSIGKEAVLNLLVRAIEDLVVDCKGGLNRILGIGIGIGGLIHTEDGSVEFLSHLSNWGTIELKKVLHEKFHVKTSIENNSASAALGELRFGIGYGKKNFLFINVKSGIGMGIVLNGELYRGTTGTAGEFGHVTVDDHGPVCTCGNVGCLETFASVSALVDNAKRSVVQGIISAINDLTDGDPNKITFDVILEAARQEDKLAYKLFIDAARYLGEGMVSLVNLLNPELIVIGGEFARAEAYISGAITDVMKRQALGIPRRAVQVIFSKLGENASALGATVVLIDEFFTNPLKS